MVKAEATRDEYDWEDVQEEEDGDSNSYKGTVHTFMGINLTSRDGSPPIPAYDTTKASKILRLRIAPDIAVDGKTAFDAIQQYFVKKNRIPQTLSIKLPDGTKEAVRISYSPPAGDEISFGSHAQDMRLIGEGVSASAARNFVSS
eukprot:GHVU01096936.1.p1 GENE.GHVU01096936.1~~GHVU01096936.1.p1  ORF type:complete len:145 (-),score=23.49 GHVU01096936.1:1602-2036(-)